jgi:hypothetical protein
VRRAGVPPNDSFDRRVGIPVTKADGHGFSGDQLNEVKEVLRVWLGVPGSRPPGLGTIAAHCGVDRKTHAGTSRPRRPRSCSVATGSTPLTTG